MKTIKNIPAIKINKELTHSFKLDDVKADAADFRSWYTPGDLMQAFIQALHDETDEWVNELNGDVISIEVEAFDAGYNRNYETSFSVNAVLFTGFAFAVVHFFVTKDLKVNTDSLYSFDGKYHGKMYDVDIYHPVRCIGRNNFMEDMILSHNKRITKKDA